MAYVQPNTFLILFAGVELDKDYRSTAWFPNESRQRAWFVTNHVHKSYSDFTYIRKSENVIQVPELITDLKEYNYLLFENERAISTGNYSKTYYAFIDRREYVNEKCTNIYFTVDPIQTYMFNYSVGYCTIEREHPNSDAIGENIVPEPIDVGDVLPQKQDILTPFSLLAGDEALRGSKCGAIFYFFLPDNAFGEDRGFLSPYNTGKFTGLTAIGFTSQSETLLQSINIQKIIDALTKCKCTVVNVQIVPEEIIKNCSTLPAMAMTELVGASWAQNFSGTGVKLGYLIDTFAHYTKMLNLAYLAFSRADGFKYGAKTGNTYTPRNNKLYTSPYRYLKLSSFSGDNVNLRWEFTSAKNRMYFDVIANTANNVTLHCYPTAYKGNAGANYDIKLSYDSFPQASFSVDYYTRWQVEKQSALQAQIATNNIATNVRTMGAALVATAIPAMAPMAAISAASGLANKITTRGNALAQQIEAKDAFDICQTGQSDSDLDYWQNRVGFYCTDYGVSGEQAEIIDSYFDLYGYAINRMKKPDITDRWADKFPREAWYYLKTNGCRIDVTVENGKYSIPADDEVRICQIYDNGITFWNVEDETVTIGDYSHSNTPAKGY